MAVTARCTSRERKECGVIKGDVPGTRDRDEVRTRRRELNAAKEVTIPDYVMLDFVDDTPDTQQDPQRKTIEDPGLRY